MTSAFMEQGFHALSASSCRAGRLQSIHRGICRCQAMATAPAANFVMTLARRRVAALTTRGPVDIRCLSGQLWITQLGKASDTVLQAGQQHTLSQATRDIVLSTAGSPYPATFEIISRPRTRHGLWRMLQRLRPHFELELA